MPNNPSFFYQWAEFEFKSSTFHEFYNCGIIHELYAIFSGGAAGTTEGGKITNDIV